MSSSLNSPVLRAATDQSLMDILLKKTFCRSEEVKQLMQNRNMSPRVSRKTGNGQIRFNHGQWRISGMPVCVKINQNERFSSALFWQLGREFG